MWMHCMAVPHSRRAWTVPRTRARPSFQCQSAWVDLPPAASTPFDS